MKDRVNPLKRVTGIAETVAAGARRRQQSREPRVVIYDGSGHSRVLGPEADGHEGVVEAAERLIEKSEV
jgi:hypothetical protein